MKIRIELEPSAWHLLSMRDRANYIHLSILNHFAKGGSISDVSIDDIRHKFDEGGIILPEVEVTTSYPNEEQIKRNIESQWLSAKNLSPYRITVDSNFTKDLTGAGSIEYFNSPFILYNNGTVVRNPNYYLPTLLFNPNDNTVDDIKLDLLHHYRAYDSEYQKRLKEYLDILMNNNETADLVLWNSELGDRFRETLKTSVGYRKPTDQDWEIWNLMVLDALDNLEYITLGVDGSLRNLLANNYTIEHSNYAPKEEAQRQWLNTPEGLQAFDNLNSYLLNGYKQGGSIHIKPENKGKFTEYLNRTGNTLLEALHSPNAHVRLMANFARNAKKWKHNNGGYLYDEGGYTVKQGDYLGKIALMYNTTVDSLMLLNGITDPTKLQIGLVLKIYADSNNPQQTKSINTDSNYSTNTKTPSRQLIIQTSWENENPSKRGLLKDGTYKQYPDPNGRGMDVGPGLLVGKIIKSKPNYTKKELDETAYLFGLTGLQAIGQEYNKVYGNSKYPTPWDTVSVAPKLLMLDTRYLNGSLPLSGWPSLYLAVADGNWAEALKLSRSTYEDELKKKHYDNDRVRRRAETLFPGMFTVTYKKDNALYPTILPIKR